MLTLNQPIVPLALGDASEDDPEDDRPNLGSGLKTGSKNLFHLPLNSILQSWAFKRGYSDKEPLALVLFKLHDLTEIQRRRGDRGLSSLIDAIEVTLRENAAQVISEADLRLVERLEDGSLILIFHQPGQSPTSLRRQATRLKVLVSEHLEHRLLDINPQNRHLLVGYTLTAGLGSEQVYQGCLEAERLASGLMDYDQLGLMRQFKAILSQGSISPVYQPIADLRSGRIFGWEALSRGPEGSYFHSPAVLFDFAESLNCMFALEKVCRERAVAGSGRLGSDQKLFLNINPRTLADPAFTPGDTQRILDRAGLVPQKVVFEITERTAISDFSLFTKTLEHYRSQGYLVAIDDVGAGYSGLKRIARLRPDLIKVDMSLVQGIDTNPVQRALVETLVTFADKIGCSIIAEGIETETELSCLRAMGVHYGQGFFLGRPANPRPELAVDLSPLISPGFQSLSELKISIPIRDLVEAAVCVSPQTTGGEVRALIESGEPIGGVVVVEEDRPVGLVMSHKLDRHLSTQYGVSLYYERNISNLMDTSPLMVEGQTPVELVAEKAAHRERFKLYDHIIVTDKGRLMGIVSVQRVLDTLAKVQVEMARGANPLTGLPGNVAIDTEISRRAVAGEPTSLIYADLDNFKVFNDAYGFDKGDRMILLLAGILTWAANRHGTGQDHIGHVGGDDFVIMTDPSRAERICRAVIRVFGRLVKGHYAEEDRARGSINGIGRNGERADFPLSTVSLAIVDCHDARELTSVAQVAAEMKKYAKTIEGNCYVRDRRRRKPAPERVRTEEPDGSFRTWFSGVPG